MTQRLIPNYSLDCSALEVGSVIPTTELIDLIRSTPEARRWDQRVQSLIRHIQQQRPDLLCAQRRDTIVVLPADERAEVVTQRLANQTAAMLRTTEIAQDPIRMQTGKMSEVVRRGFESVSRTAGALAESVKRTALMNDKIKGLLTTREKTGLES